VFMTNGPYRATGSPSGTPPRSSRRAGELARRERSAGWNRPGRTGPPGCQHLAPSVPARTAPPRRSRTPGVRRDRTST
jgi:hypothetical protein